MVWYCMVWCIWIPAKGGIGMGWDGIDEYEGLDWLCMLMLGSARERFWWDCSMSGLDGWIDGWNGWVGGLFYIYRLID